MFPKCFFLSLRLKSSSTFPLKELDPLNSTNFPPKKAQQRQSFVNHLKTTLLPEMKSLLPEMTNDGVLKCQNFGNKIKSVRSFIWTGRIFWLKFAFKLHIFHLLFLLSILFYLFGFREFTYEARHNRDVKP